ncbi:MAG TPA: GNAT family N-acetyltransferase [Candidatus Limnocylindrales bacterium]|nr:GNAT family N-acetyltransferase [Candidatus Limnocylindrales bacterium]
MCFQRGSTDPLRLRRVATSELTAGETAAIRALLVTAFGDDPDERFGDDDWDHALGGVHYVLDDGAQIVGHAALVERELHVAGRPLRTGYVEAVATAPARQGRGLGTRIMTQVNADIRAGFELGALGTGWHAFYERLGWLRWRGPSSVRVPDGERRTPDEDGYILVLPTASTRLLDLDAPISCDWRSGDVW